MAHPNVEVLRASDQKFLSGDIDGFFGYVTDDVTLHVGGDNRFSGDYKGKDQMKEAVGRLIEAAGDYSFENHAYLADDEHGLMLQTGKFERDGKTLELREIFVVHFRDGKISEMWYYPADNVALDAWVGN